MTTDQLADEVLETLWAMKEQGAADENGRFPADETCRILEALGNLTGKEEFREMLKRLEEGGFIRMEEEWIAWTPEGESASRSITRRHRLAERLLSEVFALSAENVESGACSFEHILSPEVEESICAFLGHPPVCPHGRPIPPGKCCRKFSSDVRALVVPLRELKAGDSAKIVFISTKDKTRFEKLGSFGIMPDSIITLRQKQPSFIVQCGETDVAIDVEIAREIFVKKTL